jgi:hypothetical protein
VKVPLPNLDDLRWVDLVDEGRSLIPLYAPDWTDHNVHDPGITLMELLAWVAEMDIYELNRISDEHKRKFLALIGIRPFFPRAAETVLGFNFKNGPQPPHFKASAEFSGKDAFGVETRFRTLDRVDLAKGELKALQVRDLTGLNDVTELWQRGESISAFGAIPERGAELYLGFSHAFPANQPVTLYFKLAGTDSGAEARRRLIVEERARRWACRPPSSDVTCKRSRHSPESHISEEALIELPAHHGARVVWEFLSIDNEWIALTGAAQLNDDTRSLTLDGSVIVTVPGKMGQLSLGRVAEPLYYVRSRFDAGDYDAPPSLQAVVLNGVRAMQSTSVSVEWPINSDVVPNGPSPAPTHQTALRLRFDANRHITHLDFTKHSEHDPLFRVLAYVPPSGATAGRLAIEAKVIGRGTGLPHQEVALRDAPVSAPSLDVFTLENDVWRVWRRRNDFDPSTRRDADFVLEPDARRVIFGDGEKGRVPPRDSLIFATYRSTRAENGNLEARAVYKLVDSPHNRPLFPNFDVLNDRFRNNFKVTDSALASLRTDGVPESVLERLDDIKDKEIREETEFTRALKIMLGEEQANRYGQSILKHSRILCDLDSSECMVVSNPVAAEGGTPAETLFEASGRAVQLMSDPNRAVTLKDYETLAKRTPGTRIARTAARANLHPNFTCLKAPGVITVVVLPEMPVARPTPSYGLKRAVARYLNRRRIIGTRVEVVGAGYLEVAVEARVKAHPGVNRQDLQQRIVNALNAFFDPFKGGPEGNGWPFGRDVYRSEILQVIDELEGVDYILSLNLIAEGCDPQCGNVCLPPTTLVTVGRHEIEVI